MVVVLMGVSGSGKTTLGLRLADDLGWTFIDSDDLHTLRNVEKMARREPLSDEDVGQWMTVLRERVSKAVACGENAILACSALKSGYRRQLTVDPRAVRFVYLKGSASLIRSRLRSRSGHFLRENILVHQFAALEEPHDAVTVNIDERPGRIVNQIRAALFL